MKKRQKREDKAKRKAERDAAKKLGPLGEGDPDQPPTEGDSPPTDSTPGD